MGDYVDPQWRKHAEGSGLSNEITRHIIEKCSNPDAWYAGMVGKMVSVHYFSTFGAWTPEGKWIAYYDLSTEIGK